MTVSSQRRGLRAESEKFLDRSKLEKKLNRNRATLSTRWQPHYRSVAVKCVNIGQKRATGRANRGGFYFIRKGIRSRSKEMLSRRNILATAAAGVALSTTTARAATFGNPDEPDEGAVNVTNPKALIDPGPQDQGLAGNEPAFLDPPATDVNGMPQYWASFNLSPKRIQNGGWARRLVAVMSV